MRPASVCIQQPDSLINKLPQINVEPDKDQEELMNDEQSDNEIVEKVEIKGALKIADIQIEESKEEQKEPETKI